MRMTVKIVHELLDLLLCLEEPRILWPQSESRIDPLIHLVDAEIVLEFLKGLVIDHRPTVWRIHILHNRREEILVKVDEIEKIETIEITDLHTKMIREDSLLWIVGDVVATLLLEVIDNFVTLTLAKRIRELLLLVEDSDTALIVIVLLTTVIGCSIIKVGKILVGTHRIRRIVVRNLTRIIARNTDNSLLTNLRRLSHLS